MFLKKQTESLRCMHIHAYLSFRSSLFGSFQVGWLSTQPPCWSHLLQILRVLAGDVQVKDTVVDEEHQLELPSREEDDDYDR